MKTIYTKAVMLFLFLGALSQEVIGQSLRLDIRNQQYVEDTMYFDIYLSRNGGTTNYYLGDADFALTFNNANFTTPTIGYIAGTSNLKNSNGNPTTAYGDNLAATIGTSNPNTNKIIINLLQPSFSGQGGFDSIIAQIDTAQNTHRLGKFWVKGLQSHFQTTGLTWYMSGSGIKTTAFTLANTSNWKSSKINNYTPNNPTPGTTPTVQTSDLLVNSVTDTTMNLSWTRGNGTQTIIFAQEASAIGSNPTNGIFFNADDSLGLGSELGNGSGIFAVYRGTGSSVTINNLDPATIYHFIAFEVYGENGHNEAYNITSPATATDTTLHAEPTIPATDLLVTAWDTNQLTLTWTSGDGSNRVVIARKAAAVNQLPEDGNAYTSNTIFKSGENLSDSNFVVYDGSGSTTTITGLEPNTVYHFSVIEYNGTFNNKNYLLDGVPAVDRTTLQSEPTVAASNLVVNNVTSSSFRINWTTGNGTEKIVLIKEANAVNDNPSDGFAYTGNAAYAAGDTIGTDNYVVYRGSDTTVNVTGLDPNTVYHFEIFELDGSGDASNYFTASTLIGSQLTLQDAPTISARDLMITEVTTSSMKLKWTSGNGANRVVVAKAVTEPGFAVNGSTYTANNTFASGDTVRANEYIVYNGSGDSVVVNGLSQDTIYHFAVYEYNGSGGAENFLNSDTATNSQNTAFYLNAFALLEGPYNGTFMDTTLNEEALIPSAQPYNAGPWNYAGTETVASAPDNAVDWVLVELRKAPSAANAIVDSIVFRQAAFINHLGQIVDTLGNPLFVMPDEAGYGNYFLLIYHRNHIGVMSAAKITYNADSNAFVYDFTTAANTAYGTDALVEVSGKFALFGGNADPSATVIDADDRDNAWTDRNKYGYEYSDVNLDGNVDAADRSLIYNNTGQDDQTP